MKLRVVLLIACLPLLLTWLSGPNHFVRPLARCFFVVKSRSDCLRTRRTSEQKGNDHAGDWPH